MPRSRQVIRYVQTFLASALGLFAAGERTQTPAPPPVTPTGRVCVLKSFGAGTPAGAVEPIWFSSTGAIAVGADSNLYSTSPQGGKYGAGTIFRISPTGEVRVLHDFINYNKDEGAGPASGLVDGRDGYFYGTTYGGGHIGTGTLFRIRPGETTPQILWNFRNGSTIGLWPDCADPYHRCPYTGRQRADISAAYPTTPPVVGPGGVLYGVTGYSNNQGFGVLYRDAPPYDSTSFHALCIFDQRLLADTAMKQFVCKAKSTFPNALLLGRDGSLYGTTLGGYGTVFRATTGGDVTTIHEFDLTHGSKPYNLMQASNGRLYGIAFNGGDTGGGIVYGLDTGGGGLLGGGFKVMTSLRVGSWLQGYNPVGGLVEVDWPGREYTQPLLVGTTQIGGKNGRGIIFSMPLDGDSLSLRLLHEFDLYGTGRTPKIALMPGPGGLLYGLTYQGGAYDKGAFFSLDPKVPAPLVHDAWLYNGLAAKDDAGVQLSDTIVQVMTGVTGTQGTPATTYTDGITVRAHCANPHIVQFIYRVRIASSNVLLPGTMSPTSGTYQLTTDTTRIFWRTDVPLAKDPSLRGHYNAYLDQALGAVHSSGPWTATIFDVPNFPEPAYPAAGQLADPTLSETWRITARDFVVCNCKVAREVWWSREERGGKIKYTHIRIVNPMKDALDWINANLQVDGYAPIP